MLRKLTSNKMIFAFAITYLVLAFLTFTFVTAQVLYLKYISYIVATWGLLLIVFSLFNKDNWKLSWQTLLSVLFVISALISSLFMAKYGMGENIKGLIWLSLELIVLFSLNNSNTESKYLKYFLITFIAISTFYAILSLVMAIIGYMHYPVSIPGDTSNGGIGHGRLYGMYSDPNYGAITAVLTILSVLYLYKKSKFNLFICIIIIVPQLAYVALSGSRSGLIALILSSMIATFFIIYATKKKIILCILASLAIGVGLFGINMAIETSYENLEPQILKCLGGPITDPKHAFTVQFADKIREECGLANPYENNEGFNHGEVNSEHVGVMGREEVKEDVSNKRIDIWKSSIEMFSQSPLIGLSNRNYLSFAKDNIPDTFVATINFESLHNVFVDVAVSQGIIGLIIWCALLLTIFLSIIKHINYKKSILLSMFVALLIMGMFYSEVIYVNTIGSVFFWYVFGHLPKTSIKIGERNETKN